MEREGCVFVCNFSHTPNVDAVLWLVWEIMPHVWAKALHIRGFIAGHALPSVIKAPGRDPRVVVLGHVSDLAALLQKAWVSAASLRFGTGIKGKILEAMVAGLATVMTSVGAEDWRCRPVFPKW